MTNLPMVQTNKDLLDDCKAVNARLPILGIHSGMSKKNTKPETRHLAAYIGHLVLINSAADYNDLGDSVDVVNIGFRLKATEYKNNAYKSVYAGVQSGGDEDLYREWRQNAKDRIQGYKYGPEFLVYLPDFGKFATLYSGTDADRKHCSSVITADENHRNFTIATFDYSGGSIKFPRIIMSASRCDLELEQPDEDLTNEVINQFLNPPVFTEAVEDPGDER